MSEDQVLELLDIYMTLTEKQDEIIARLSAVVAKQATELAHIKNLSRMDNNADMQLDIDIANEVIAEYKKMTTEP